MSKWIRQLDATWFSLSTATGLSAAILLRTCAVFHLGELFAFVFGAGWMAAVACSFFLWEKHRQKKREIDQTGVAK